MKLFLICFMAFSISTSLLSQDYIPFPADSTSEWDIWTGLSDGMCIQNKDFKYFFNGDTMY
jgi:hypothetical protein